MTLESVTEDSVLFDLRNSADLLHLSLPQPFNDDRRLSSPEDYFDWKQWILSEFKKRGPYILPYVNDGKIPDSTTNADILKDELDSIVQLSILSTIAPSYVSKIHSMKKYGLELWKEMEMKYGHPSPHFMLKMYKQMLAPRAPTETVDDFTSRIIKALKVISRGDDDISSKEMRGYIILAHLNNDKLEDTVLRNGEEVTMWNVYKGLDALPGSVRNCHLPSSTDKIAAQPSYNSDALASPGRGHKEVSHKIQKTLPNRKNFHSRPKCNVCQKIGHVAMNCRYAKERIHKDKSYNFLEINDTF